MTSRFPTAEEFASFPPPNFVDPETKTNLILGIEIPMSVLATLFIACRFYSRTRIVSALGSDDWIMLAAAIMAVANNILVMVSTSPDIQTGYHLWDFHPEHFFGTMKAGQIGMSIQLIFIVTCSLMKTSVLITYLRIFPSRLNKWFCHTLLAYTIAWMFTGFFIVLFQCSPPETYWMIFKYFHRAKCLNTKAIYYIQGANSTLTDFLIFLWPAKNLMEVKISRRQRITLIAMFSFGLIVCVAGSARVYYTWAYLNNYDIFWYAANAYVVMSIEAGVGIACGCLPGCKPLMSQLFPRVFGTTTANSANSGPSSSGKLSGKLYSSGSRASSIPLKSLSSDVIVREKTYDVEYTAADAKPYVPSMPPRPTPSFSRRFSGRGRGRAFESDGRSEDSQEYIILQGTDDLSRQHSVK